MDRHHKIILLLHPGEPRGHGDMPIPPFVWKLNWKYAHDMMINIINWMFLGTWGNREICFFLTTGFWVTFRACAIDKPDPKAEAWCQIPAESFWLAWHKVDGMIGGVTPNKHRNASVPEVWLRRKPIQIPLPRVSKQEGPPFSNLRWTGKIFICNEFSNRKCYLPGTISSLFFTLRPVHLRLFWTLKAESSQKVWRLVYIGPKPSYVG